MEESNNNASSSEQVTTEATSAETQQPESQSVEQVDTTQEVTEVSKDMSIEAKEESETSSESQRTIHDLVNAALNDELTEEDRQLIEENELGQYLEAIVEGQKAKIEKNDQEIISVVGNKESYAELQEWGANNLSAEEQEAFNDALFSGNMNLAKLAVQGLKARYEAVNGKSPERVIEGGGTVNADNRPYSDVHEYLKDTQSLEYKQNPEFRRSVESKRNLSGF